MLPDRSLCAHPSMHLLGEPFHPTPELARCHLRNAITHLLQHPPVQGKAALQHIWDIIKSEYFPEDVEQAIQSLKTSYLARARKSLIRNIVIGLTKSLLLENKPRTEKRRMIAAIKAIKYLYFEQATSVINENLSQIINKISDERWSFLFFYIRIMDAWEALDNSQKIKAKTYIQAITKIDQGTVYILLTSLEIKEIEELAFNQVTKFKDGELDALIKIIYKHRETLKSSKIVNIIDIYKPYVIEKFVESKNFYNSELYGNKLMFISEDLKEEEIKDILKSFCENDQIHLAVEVPEIMTEFFNKTINLVDSTKNEWLSVREKIEGRDVYNELINLIDKHCRN